MNCNKESIIIINDIFDELKAENNRLFNQLLFANKCLDVLNKINESFDGICGQFEDQLDSQQKLLLNNLRNEYKNVVKNIYSNENYIKTEKEFSDKCFDKCNQSFGINGNELELNKNLIIPQINSIISRKISQKLSEKSISKIVTNNDLIDKQIKIYETINKNIAENKLNSKNVFLKNSIKSTKSELNDKNRTKTRKYIHKCDWIGCDYKTYERYLLNAHKLTHSGERPFKCQVFGCDKSFKSKRELRYHTIGVHELNKTIVCKVMDCKKMFKTIIGMKKHMITHSDYRPFACNYTNCSFTARNKTNLEIHLLTHSSERLFKCSFSGCEKRFKSYSTMKGHLQTHNSEPTLKCSFEGCEQLFKTYWVLYKHKKSHRTQPIVISCDWPACDFKTDKNHYLNKHKLIHTGEKNHICQWPECGKRFRLRKQLIQHLRVHNNDKKYVCLWPGCEHKCNNASNLIKHKKIHNKVKY